MLLIHIIHIMAILYVSYQDGPLRGAAYYFLRNIKVACRRTCSKLSRELRYVLMI